MSAACEDWRDALASGKTVAEVAEARGVSRKAILDWSGSAVLRAGYRAREAARWGEAPNRPVLPPSPAELARSVLRVLGHPLGHKKAPRRRRSKRLGQLAGRVIVSSVSAKS